jgi:hypothetical protein
MADRVLFISWGENVAGREARGLEVFNETIGMYGRLQDEGAIESFNVVLLQANAGMDGYVEVRGSAEQLSAVRESDEFIKSILDASLIVHDMRVVEGFTGAGIARVMGMYQESLGAVPQPA